VNRLSTLQSGNPVRTAGWQVPLIALAVAVVILGAVYWRTIGSLIWVWSHDGTYQYAFLIFPLSIWTAFNLRRELLASAPRPCIWGLPIVAGLSFIWLVGNLVSINVLQHFALVAMFPALVLIFWGWRAVRVLAFPLGYLLFAIPWGDSLVGPLQDFTAHFSVRALELIGTPVLLIGREITTPSAVWNVEAACSGVKFFIASTALGCLFAYLMYHRWWKRLLFVALAAVVPIIANGLRVFFTILIGDTWGLKYATGTDHLIFGWQFFGSVLALLLVVGWLFRDPAVTTHPLPGNGDRVFSWQGAVWVAAIALVVAGPALALWIQLPSVEAGKVILTAPIVSGWRGPESSMSGWHPSFQGADAEIHVAYSNAATGTGVELFNALYIGRPRHGHDLITYGNTLYDPVKVTVLDNGTHKVLLSDSHAFRVQELRLATANGSRIVWYWYCVDGRCTASAIAVKLRQIVDMLTGRHSRSSVWAMSVVGVADEAAAMRASLAAFMAAVPGIIGQGPQPDAAALMQTASRP